MVFSSAVFLLYFLPIVYLGNALIKKEYSNYFLLSASLLFYAWGEPIYIIIMLASVTFNWIFGMILDRITKPHGRKIILGIGIACNLLVLFYFKYFNFFGEIVKKIFGKEIVGQMEEISLPIGISFFTFQAISYIFDVYRKDTEASKRLVNVALYISFFPQLIAGPIVKYKDINKQINERSINSDGLYAGFKRFIYGLGKKVLIANVLGLCADKIYAIPIDLLAGSTAWIGAVAYTFQIYYDFSGYSDMAIGLGKMFGFDIQENFNYPYQSHSITEFWRRWHISLGTWFREYLYIPLGGNKKGKFRTYINLGVVFLLTGLWHGADMSYVIWGIYHGFFAIVERCGLKKLLDKCKFISLLYALIIVNFGWVLFRAESLYIGLRYLKHMILPWKYTYTSVDIWNYMDTKTVICFLLALLGAGMIKDFCPPRVKNKWKGSISESIYCICVLILSLAAIASDTYNPFIYFQF